MTRSPPKLKERKPQDGHVRLGPSGQFVVWDGGRPGAAKGLYLSPEDVDARSSELSIAFGLGSTTAFSVFSAIESIAPKRSSPERRALAGLIGPEEYIRLSNRAVAAEDRSGWHDKGRGEAELTRRRKAVADTQSKRVRIKT